MFGARRDYGAHKGTDYRGARGTPVYSSNGGGIYRRGSSRLGGNIATIDHGGGVVSKYMHLDRFGFADGQRIGPDDVVGYIGMTGRTTGPHLHQEVWVNGKPINPATYYRSKR